MALNNLLALQKTGKICIIGAGSARFCTVNRLLRSRYKHVNSKTGKWTVPINMTHYNIHTTAPTAVEPVLPIQLKKDESNDEIVNMLVKIASSLKYLPHWIYQKRRKKERIKAEWMNKNIARISDVTAQQIVDLFSVTLSMEQMVSNDECSNIANGKLLTTIFYEPSTRTSTSFQAAMLRLGGKVIAISESAIQSSSVSKGETFEDTIKCLGCYSDVLVIRHPEKGTPDRVMNALPEIPILNAGDGSGEHPTQALLDLFTIYKEKNHDITGLTITFVGDLKYGRTVHSLVPALSLFDIERINFVSPKQLQIEPYIMDKVKGSNINIKESDKLSQHILQSTDVLYVTRIQKERFESLDEYDKVKGCYVIDNEVLKQCKEDMIVMHPLPRDGEIAVEVDNDKRAVYFKQMKYGMYVRMALLALVLGLHC
eukprot:156934_1